MEELAHLSLVSKVAQELDNHLGVSDKVLAEFIIDLADNHGDADGFHMALEQNGAEVAKTFATNLLAIIQRMRPKKKKPGEVRFSPTGAALPSSPAPPCVTYRIPTYDSGCGGRE